MEEDTRVSTWTDEQPVENEGSREAALDSHGMPWRAAHGVPREPHKENTNKKRRQRDGQSLREAAVKRGHAVHSRRRQDGWIDDKK